MLCPRCNKHTLEERERDGITIDVCQECRGIWLDRGELERLIARAAREMDRQPEYAHSGEYRDRNDRYDGHHGRHDHHHGHEGSHHRRKHWLAELFD